MLTHGAGGGIDAPDLVRLARTLPQQDISVTLVEMPWRVAGQEARALPRPVIDECSPRVLDDMRTRSPARRSAGAAPARGRPAGSPGASVPRGVLALSFPLHPPGKPEKSRLAGAASGAGCRRW